MMDTTALLPPAIAWIAAASCLVVGGPVRGAVLVEQGVARATIVLPDDADDNERLAAAELVDHVRSISGAELPVVTTAAPRPASAILVGRAADPSLDERARAQGDDPWAFALVVDDTAVHLRGLSSQGTLAAAYELLERLGVRWYMPGDIGRVLPRSETVRLDPLATAQAPAFIGRPGSRHPAAEVWNRRLRANGGARFSSHGMQGFHTASLRKKLFAAHPEYFALIGGERRNTQLCLTNSVDGLEQNEVFQHVLTAIREMLRADPKLNLISHVNPNDGAGHCECDRCRALDPPFLSPFAGLEPSYTDRYVWFINNLAAALEQEFPDVTYGFFAYHTHMVPPVRVKPHRSIAITLAPIHVCRRHGPNNQACTESESPLVVLRHWMTHVPPEKVAWYAYGFNLSDPGFPFSQVHRMREEIPAVRARGVTRWTGGPADAWAPHLPTMYLMAKLLWDPSVDVDSLLEEFYEKFYGPAAVSMKAYHEHLDHRLRDGGFHAGGVWDVPHVFDAAWRERAGLLLDAAERETDGLQAQRVAIQRRLLEMLDAYCESRAARDAFDFVGERIAMERARDRRDDLLRDFEFPMLFPRQAESLFSRFVERPAVLHEQTTGGADSHVVARLAHEWDFMLDVGNWGRYAGFQLPVASGANWQRIRTDLPWSQQGLHHYYGAAWYRQGVHVPAEFQGRPVRLWFSGVNDTADVWINGRYVGGNHEGAEFDLDAFGAAFVPFQVDASSALVYGANNTIVVRAERKRTGELGVGGLVGPVMLYVPSLPASDRPGP
jgi:hypothetical protein